MPDAEVKKNLLYSKLIKRYKYISSEDEQVVKKQQILKKTSLKNDILPELPEIKFHRILKKGHYKKLDTSLINSDKTHNQKKNTVANLSSRNQLNETKVCFSTNSIKNDSPQNNNIGVQANSNTVNSVNRRSLDSSLKNEYNARLKKETEKSYNKGFQEGHKNGYDEASAKTDQINQVLSTITEDFNEKSQDFFNEIEEVVLDLSVHLAKKIVFDAVDMIPDIVKTNVENSVKLLAGAGRVMIKINPADYDIIKEYIPSLDQKHEGKFSFVIEPDNNITRGGSLIELNGSIIDGRVETQIETLKQHMKMLT